MWNLGILASTVYIKIFKVILDVLDLRYLLFYLPQKGAYSHEVHRAHSGHLLPFPSRGYTRYIFV